MKTARHKLQFIEQCAISSTFQEKGDSCFPFEAKNLGNNFWLIVQDNRCKPERSRRLAREGLHFHCEGLINSNVTVPFTRDSGYVIWEQFFVPGRKRKGNSENHKWKRITDLVSKQHEGYLWENAVTRCTGFITNSWKLVRGRKLKGCPDCCGTWDF